MVIDGGPISYADCSIRVLPESTTAITATPTGLAALVELTDGGFELQRYVGQDCALTWESSFPIGNASSTSDVAADDRGHVYVGRSGSSGLGTTELSIDGGSRTFHTEQNGAMAVSGDGLSLYTDFVGTFRRGTRTTAVGPFSRDFTFAPQPIDFVTAIAPAPDGGVFVAGRETSAASTQRLFTLSASGARLSAWGSTNQLAPDAFCSVASLSACSGGVCAVDLNCSKFSHWTGGGVFRATIRFPLTQQPLAVAPASPGKAWLLRRQSTGPVSSITFLGLVSGL